MKKADAVVVADQIDYEKITKRSEEALALLRPDGVENPNPIVKVVQYAQGIDILREVFAEEGLLKMAKTLQGSPLGFMADKTYADNVLTDACVQAMAQGFMLTNNEFNIISGKSMGVLNGWLGKLRREFDVRPACAVEIVEKKDRASKCKVTMSYKTKTTEWEGWIPATSYDAGPDAIVGKAKRRALKYLWEVLAGGMVIEAEDPDGAIDITAKPVVTHDDDGADTDLGPTEKAAKESEEEIALRKAKLQADVTTKVQAEKGGLFG